MNLEEIVRDALSKIGYEFTKGWNEKLVEEVLGLRKQIETKKPVKKCGITFLPGVGRCKDE
jgi:hypothetical protein